MVDHHDSHPAPGEKRHRVHVYTVIRITVAVDADDHRAAMEAADRLLFDQGLPVRLVPTDACVETAEHADEVIGYLVDEADDEDHRRTRCYGADHQPERKRVDHSDRL